MYVFARVAVLNGFICHFTHCQIRPFNTRDMGYCQQPLVTLVLVLVNMYREKSKQTQGVEPILL